MDDFTAPPCVKLGTPMNHCAKARYSEQILGHIALVGDWQKWKFKGRDLVSPDGHRISPEALRGILMREATKQRALALKNKDKPSATVTDIRTRFISK